MKNKRGRQRTRGAVLVLLATLADLAPAAPAQTGGVMSGQQLATILEESGKALSNLALARDQSVPAALKGRRDGHGRRVKAPARV